MKSIFSSNKSGLLQGRNDSTFLPDASNTIFTSFMMAARMACQAIVLIIVARLLGVEGYGVFAAVVALALLFAPFSGLGSDFLALRAVAQYPNMESRIFLRGLIITITSAVPIVGLVTLLAVWWFPESVPPALIIAVLISDILCLRCTELVAKIYQGRERFIHMGLVRLLAPLCRVAAAAILWAASIDATPTVWAQYYLAGSFVAATLAGVLLLTDFGHIRTGSKVMPYDFQDGLHFAGGVASSRFHTQVDKSLVLVLSGAAGAGIYTAAYRIVEFTLMPVTAFASVIYGRMFYHAQHRGQTSVATLAAGLIWPCLLCGLSMAAMLWFFLVSIMEWTLGRTFATVEDGLLPLALLPIPMAFRLVAEQSVAAMGLLHERSRIQWTAAAIAMGGNVLFIPAYGWVAAAWICLGIEALLSVVYIVVIGRQRSELIGGGVGL